MTDMQLQFVSIIIVGSHDFEKLNNTSTKEGKKVCKTKLLGRYIT